MSYYFLQTPISITQTASQHEFPISSLPGNVSEYVEHVAEAVQVHKDMPASLSLAVLASCAQGKAQIQLTPEWHEELNLYISVVADPGERKSAVFSALTRPVTNYVNNFNQNHALEICSYNNRLARLISNKNSLINSNATDEEIAEVQSEISKMKANPKTEMRLVATDCTAEAVASVMSSNHDKIAILSDEGVFDIMGGLYNNGKANINIYLNSYDGQPITIDRKSSGSILLDRPLITFGICCQPSVIADFVADKRFIGKGLAQRFLFCQPPSLCGKRMLSSVPINEKIKSNYYSVAYRILNMRNSDRNILLSPEASKLFGSYYNEIEAKIGQLGKYSISRTFLSKLMGKTARISGLLHLCTENVSSPISPTTMSNAIDIARYFDSQNDYLFNTNTDMLVAEYVADRIITNARKDRCDSYRARDLKRFCQKYKSDVLEEGLIILEERHYIFFEPDNKSKPNRRFGTFIVNPYLLRNNDCQAPVMPLSNI